MKVTRIMRDGRFLTAYSVYAALRFNFERKVLNVIEYRMCSTGGMLCCHPDRASACMT